MYRKQNPHILWQNNLRTYMYGSEVSFGPDASVTFYNPLMPSGTDIIIWESILNYQGSRSQPALPLLKKGQSYHLEAQLTSQPENSVFLKIVFVNRYNEELSQVIAKTQEVTFTYPEDAYAYRVSLLSAGVTQLVFDHMVITEAGEDDVETL